jgi:hypothetical protein
MGRTLNGRFPSKQAGFAGLAAARAAFDGILAVFFTSVFKRRRTIATTARDRAGIKSAPKPERSVPVPAKWSKTSCA